MTPIDELQCHINDLTDAIAALRELRALFTDAGSGMEMRIAASKNFRMTRALLFANHAMRLHLTESEQTLADHVSAAREWGRDH